MINAQYLDHFESRDAFWQEEDDFQAGATQAYSSQNTAVSGR